MAPEPDFAGAIRIIVEHVNMSTDARRQVRLFIGDEDIRPATPVIIDPRDAEIERLKALLAAKPIDDEPVTAEEKAAIEAARSELDVPFRRPRRKKVAVEA